MLIGTCRVGAYTKPCRPNVLHVISSAHALGLKNEACMKLTQWMAAPVAGSLFFNGSAIAQNDQAGAAANQGAQPATGAKPEFRITCVTPAY
jgi:hypothetical protein